MEIAIVLVIIVGIFIAKGLRVVPQQNAWVVERLGKYHATLSPGLSIIIPFVDRVTNPDPTTGGVNAETIENAKIRGPLALRGGSRAVTVEDFERAAMDAARGVARARCVQPVNVLSASSTT